MTALNREAGQSRGRRREDGPTPVSRVAGWLRSSEARALDDAGLLSSLGRYLHRGGLSFDRLTFHVGTLHPEIFARVLAWSANEPVEIYERDHPATVAAGFIESPLYRAASSKDKLVAQGGDCRFLGRAGGHLLQSRGIGEIVSAPFERHGRKIVVSFCVARPQVFRAADHLVIEGAITALQHKS